MPTMVSTLKRLFTFAKASEAGALENFTTEALAGAIRVEPAPFVDLLQAAGLLPAGDVGDVAVRTQVPVAGAGQIDLALHCLADGRRHELWGELKVAAAETGQQLDSYRRHIDGLDATRRPVLFTLAKRPIRSDSSIPFVSWHDLRRRVLQMGAGPAWRDFAQFLAEVHMSDDFDQLVTARESAAMADFAHLFGKTQRILEEVMTTASTRWPGFDWHIGKDLNRELIRRFGDKQDLLAIVFPQGLPRTSYLAVGLRPVDGEAFAEVHAETFPAQADLQREIVALADDVGFGPEWSRRFGAWGGVVQAERLVSMGPHDAIVAWFVARLEELNASGVLARMTRRDGAQHPGEIYSGSEP